MLGKKIPFKDMPYRLVHIQGDAFGHPVETHEYARTLETLDELGYEIIHCSKDRHGIPEILALAVHPEKSMYVKMLDWDQYQIEHTLVIGSIEPTIPSDVDDLKSRVENATEEIAKLYNDKRGADTARVPHLIIPRYYE